MFDHVFEFDHTKSDHIFDFEYISATLFEFDHISDSNLTMQGSI